MGVSGRLGGQIPPRHQDVELIKSDPAEPGIPAETDEVEPTGGSRTVAIAVIAGIAIGMGVSAAVIMALR